MKNMKILLAAAIAVLAAGCYNDFDTPTVKVWQESEVQAMGLQQMTIAQVKQKFNEYFGSISGTGQNKSWGDTKTVKFGRPDPFENDVEGATAFWEEGANYYIKGKVISSDEQGNIYKSLYIYDGTAAIELKLSGTLYTTYKLNLETMESSYVYVLLKDLYLGNYRMMLSLGGAPTDSYNVVREHKFYANSNLELPQEVAAHVLPGEACKLVDGEDILNVDASNYQEVLGEKSLARLVRFNDIKVRYVGVKNQNNETNPPLKNGSYTNSFPTWVCTDVRPVVNQPWYYWAYSVNNQKLYGSVLISYNDAAEYTSDPGVYTVRTSAYSRFGMKPIPKDGTTGNVLGIFAIYSQQSTFTGGSRDYAQYQITVSRYEDLDFPGDSLLDPAWIAANTPAESYNPPIVDDSEDSEL